MGRYIETGYGGGGGHDGWGGRGGYDRGRSRRYELHEHRDESNGRARKRSPLLIPRLIAASLKSAPFATLVLIAGAVGGGVITAWELVLGRRIVDSLSNALTRQGAGSASAGGASAVAGSAGSLAAYSDVVVWVGWLAAAMIAVTLLELINHLAAIDAQEKVGMHLQREVIVKAHSVDLVYFEHPTFYDALQRANQDMGGRLVQLLRAIVDVLGSITGLLAILAVLWQAHWSLAPIMAVGVAPGFAVMLAMRRKSYWVYRMRTPESRLSNYINGLLTRRDEAKEVRLFTLAGHLLERWLALAKRLAVERRQVDVKQAWLGSLADLLALAAYSGCLVLIASLIAGARVTVGTFYMLMQGLLQFSSRIENVMRNLTTLHEQSLYLADLYEFLEMDISDIAFGQATPGRKGWRRRRRPAEEPGAEPGEGARERGELAGERSEGDGERSEGAAARGWDRANGAPALQPSILVNGSSIFARDRLVVDESSKLGKIELRNVWFSYPSSTEPVLRDISLTIEPGERIALIGENGAGKSTLVRIIMGLYKPSRGEVLIDGRNVEEIPPKELRGYFAAVFQEFVRYWFTVSDNIRFGRLHDATDADVRRAAELSGAASFVEAMEDGYGTLLGRPLGGADLSGGQWQKLAIARAIVRRAAIVVLDEPTASLDPKAEAEIYRQFGEITRGRTAILISHRLGSARLADRIIVLKGGRLIESGSHEELVAAGGEYAGFFRLQARWYQ